MIRHASLFLLLLLPLLPGLAQAYNLFEDSRWSKARQIEMQNQRKLLQAHTNIDETSAAATSATATNRDKESSDYSHPLPLPSTKSTHSSGLFHTCAITYRAGVDQGTCGEHPCGPVRCWGHNDKGQSTPPSGFFQQLSSGGFFTCGLKVGGKIECWGDIDHPPKTLESLSSEEQSDLRHARRLQQEAEGWRGSTTRPVNGDGYYVQVSSGLKHACAITRYDLTVHCWGRNDYGEGSPPEGKFVQISAGHSFTCGIRPHGAVQCWGKNDMGQSSPPHYPSYAFQQVSASIGGDHACGVLSGNGAVHCWGNNSRGQSENMSEGSFLQVTAGTRTTCAIRIIDTDKADNADTSTSLVCWGSRANAVPDHILDGIDNKHRHISMGQDHACVSANNNNGTTQTSIQCWWMAGSDYDAHHVPAGLVMVA